MFGCQIRQFVGESENKLWNNVQKIQRSKGYGFKIS